MGLKERHVLDSWRTGRHLGRTVYAQLGDQASDEDMLLGMMDTPELGAMVCAEHNRWRELRTWLDGQASWLEQQAQANPQDYDKFGLHLTDMNARYYRLFLAKMDDLEQ